MPGGVWSRALASRLPTIWRRRCFVADHGRRAGDEFDGTVGLDGPGVADRVVDEAVEGQRRRLERPALVEAGQQQHVVDQETHPPSLLLHPAHARRRRRRLPQAAGPPELGVAPDRRQRRAQLVGGVGHELAQLLLVGRPPAGGPQDRGGQRSHRPEDEDAGHALDRQHPAERGVEVVEPGAEDEGAVLPRALEGDNPPLLAPGGRGDGEGPQVVGGRAHLLGRHAVRKSRSGGVVLPQAGPEARHAAVGAGEADEVLGVDARSRVTGQRRARPGAEAPGRGPGNALRSRPRRNGSAAWATWSSTRPSRKDRNVAASTTSVAARIPATTRNPTRTRSAHLGEPQRVADTPDRLDQRRVEPVDLLPEIRNVRIDNARVSSEVVLPDVVEDLGPGQDPCRRWPAGTAAACTRWATGRSALPPGGRCGRRRRSRGRRRRPATCASAGRGGAGWRGCGRRPPRG